MNKKLLFIFGTRPEAIKIKESNLFDVRICITAQHREMLDDVMEFFELKIIFMGKMNNIV